MRKKRGELGSILQSFLVSNSSLTHNKHHPFDNKVWEIYFYKEVCSFVCWSRHYSWLCSSIYLFTRNIVVLWLYNSTYQEESGAIPLLHLGVVAIEKAAFWSPSTTVANFTILLYNMTCPSTKRVWFWQAPEPKELLEICYFWNNLVLTYLSGTSYQYLKISWPWRTEKCL